MLELRTSLAQLTARDVTEQRRLMRELDAQRRLLQTINDCVPAACVLFDADGTILAANPLVDHVFSLGGSEIVGRKAFEVFGNPGPSGCPLARAFLTGQIEQPVSCVKNRAGHEVYVHRIAGPVSGHEGKVEKVIEVMVDVTRQIRGGDLRILALCQGQRRASGSEGDQLGVWRALRRDPEWCRSGRRLGSTSLVASLCRFSIPR